MARDTSPIVKQSRREGVALHPKAHKIMARKSGIPGEHAGGRQGKQSMYATQLREKQKVRRMYGLLEKQFAKLMDEATRKPGLSGENLLRFLELRLDNAVYRAGFATSRRAARQLVGHKHITVDGQVVNIPSFAVKPGMVVAVREKSKSLEVVESALAGFNHSKYPWIEWDNNTKSGKFLHIPERADIPENIKEQLIVELYSK